MVNSNALIAWFRLLLFFLLLASNLFSQDYLITKSGDTIRGKITGMEDNVINMALPGDKSTVSVLFPRNDVAAFHISNDGTSSHAEKSFPRVRTGISYGISNRTAVLDPEIPDYLNGYYRKLLKGTNFRFELDYFLSENFGFGIQHNAFNTYNKLDSVSIIYSNGWGNTGSIADNMTISYSGPAFCARYLTPGRSVALMASLSMGYLRYLDIADYFNARYIIEGSTAGWSASGCIDFRVLKSLGLSLEISGVFGSYNEMEINGIEVEIDPDKAENVSRIDAAAGIKIYL